MKTRKNFRLSDEALSNLARLSGLWGCDYTAVVERALSEADPSHMDLDEREGTQAVLEEPETPVAEIIQPGLRTKVEVSPHIEDAPSLPVRQSVPTKFRQEVPKPDWKKAQKEGTYVAPPPVQVDPEANAKFQRGRKKK